MIKYILFLVLLIPGLIQGSTYRENNSNINTSTASSARDTIKDDSEKFPPTEYLLKNGKSFIILQSPESDYLVDVRVIGKGFSDSQDTIFFEEIENIDTVIIADLNNDGYEELYIFTKGFFPGAYDHVFGVASDEDKSYKEINFTNMLPDDITEGGIFYGYQGQDVYTLENNRIKRTFPLYRAGDFYDNPSGGYRTLYYTIVKTEKGFYFVYAK